MKNLLLAALACVSASAAPYSTLTNFNARHFIVVPNAASPTNVITLRLDPSQFDTNANVITLLTLGTTINPSDGYLPYRINGTTFGDSPWYMVGSDVRTDTKVLLGANDRVFFGSGSYFMFTNAVASPAIRLYNSGGDYLHLGLTPSGHGWLEVSAAGVPINVSGLQIGSTYVYPNASSPGAGNVKIGDRQVSNAIYAQVVSTNFHARGYYNSTNGDNYGVTLTHSGDTGAAILDSYSVVSGGADPRPFVWTTNGVVLATMDIHGGLYLGPYSSNLWGSPYGGEALVRINNNDLGDTDKIVLYLKTIANNGTNYSYAETIGDSTGLTYTQHVQDNNTGNRSTILLDQTSERGRIQIKREGSTKMNLEPTVTDSGSAIAYTFDTENTLTGTNSLIAKFNNNSTLKASIDKDGALSTAGTTNRWYLKSVTEGATTNAVINWNGKDYNFTVW